ncbi:MULTISPECIES: hypothetical protein [Mycobacteroides]|uniref:hypothetical protein n=1 Tax=Mycobacteroides TaxID=670516 RepID=UPI0008AA22C8|nr:MULTISPECIES: hypothetical protein [Mycobacteroides]AYM40329.1 hypothetical protein DYE20_01095 [[Mycobacterium] chelonae subsp. gwanakae]OHU15913.1 hypothetical protein BKG75_12760 [Mycobacteroides chelonae]SIF25974.1 Uncharacterised protein [Mycobacteroides abscessus subsp. abscessus]SIF39068.1 Uncharacterised protein [Mycobacteroides abscessus subsp. abscessus]SIF83190.1 Uncharacterised protein [Mycobacteroides abscessus subsp. abscessus]
MTKFRFDKPDERVKAAGRRQIVRFSGELVRMQSEPLKKLREKVLEEDTETLRWVDTVAVLRELRAVDADMAVGELNILASAVLAGAPVARACRDVWMSPEAFKAQAHETAAKHILVSIDPEAGA